RAGPSRRPDSTVGTNVVSPPLPPRIDRGRPPREREAHSPAGSYGLPSLLSQHPLGAEGGTILLTRSPKRHVLDDKLEDSPFVKPSRPRANHASAKRREHARRDSD